LRTARGSISTSISLVAASPPPVVGAKLNAWLIGLLEFGETG
jgi:hypothetical protein